MTGQKVRKSKMNAIERLIATASAEVGYLEKASNAQLDDKTANAGSRNWTKYARDLDGIGNIYNGAKNGYAWCDIFVDWCFVTTFGLELAMKLLCQSYNGLGAGCTYSMGYYKNKGQFFTSSPKAGDQIFFSEDGGKTSYHTGLVVAVDKTKVTTIEGNTSSAAGVVANGGCVRRKSYSLSYAKIAGYGRPDFSLVPEKNVNEKEETEVRYNKISEMPSYAQAHISKLVDCGYLNGRGGAKDESGRPADLDLSLDMIRILVINSRAGLYNK